MNFGYNVSFLAIDKGLIEQLGPTGFAKGLFDTSFNFSSLQKGLLFNTIFVITVFVLVLLSYFFVTTFTLSSIFNIQFVLLLFSFLLLILANKAD
jgi:hypothetical protein